MSPKPRRKPNLSAASQRIADLIESVAGGSQRQFAAQVGCSQPVLSRIVNGQQQPGRDLIERIAQLEGVDRESLLESLGEKTSAVVVEEFLIPVAQCLLRSSPAKQPDQLTAGTLAVSYTVYRPTLYAVPARMCEPAFTDPSEKLRPDDLVVIESATDRFRGNLQMLNGKLCVVVVNDETGETLTLRRIWVRFDTEHGKRVIYTCSDAKVDEYRNQKYGGRLLRPIQLDPPEQTPEPEVISEFVNEEIEISAITGMAVQLIRSL